MWSIELVWVAKVCSFLPGSPEGDVDWTLLFGDAGLNWRPQLRQTSLLHVLVRGWLQVLEVVQQSSLGLYLHLILGQEVHHLLDTPGVSLIDRCWVDRLILLQSCQEANCHLQDVCFLQLGVILLFEDLWTQERLELLNAAVDSLSAQLLHQWFSLQKAELGWQAVINLYSHAKCGCNCELQSQILFSYINRVISGFPRSY